MAETIPNRLVVLTFDAGNRSDHEFVAPLLERYGFGATFFITEGLGFRDDKEYFLTGGGAGSARPRLRDRQSHPQPTKDVGSLGRDQLIAELEHIDARCRDFGPASAVVLLSRQSHLARGGCGAGRARLRVGALRMRANAPRPPHRSSPLVPTSAAFGPAMDLAALTWTASRPLPARRCSPSTACPVPATGGYRPPRRRFATLSPGSPTAATPPSRCATWAATCRRRHRPPIPMRPGAAGTAPVSDHRTSGNSR